MSTTSKKHIKIKTESVSLDNESIEIVLYTQTICTLKSYANKLQNFSSIFS